ncbi:MAG: ribonuclease T [Gammaproteobacteria bacterium]|nr:ribonuclease T [Gammaproteobacteria bacterium]
MPLDHTNISMSSRFRGYLPVVIDVETAGFNHQTDALLEIAAVLIDMDEEGILHRGQTLHYHVRPFKGANLEKAALDFNGIDPYHPFRLAQDELDVLTNIFKAIRQAVKRYDCTRAILVGHNSAFDLNFLNAAIERTAAKRSPFHPFSSFDTATLAGLAYGQTVLARAAKEAGISWNESDAHSADYDAEKTADLFCEIVNRWRQLELSANFF